MTTVNTGEGRIENDIRDGICLLDGRESDGISETEREGVDNKSKGRVGGDETKGTRQGRSKITDEEVSGA